MGLVEKFLYPRYNSFADDYKLNKDKEELL